MYTARVRIKGCPHQTTALAKRLNGLKPVLREMGIVIKNNKSNDKKITDKIQSDIIDKTDELRQNNEGKQTPVEACRIATMGRLTELGVVSWDINKEGKSEYEIADNELAIAIKKL